MPKPTMSPAEFTEAVLDLASRTGKDAVSLARRLETTADVRSPEAPLTPADRTAHLTRVTLLARSLGIGTSAAEELVAKESA